MIRVLLKAFIAGYSFMYGDARRLIYGYDSFGNICNQQKNTPIENMTLSGRDTSGMPWVHECLSFSCIWVFFVYAVA